MNMRSILRIRPHTDKEKKKDPQSIVLVEGQTVLLKNPQDPGQDKLFSFDHCFQSLTHLETSAGPVDRSAEQILFTDTVGGDMLECVLKGDNCSAIAFGETGSGKSYSLFGNSQHDGLFQGFSRKLFQKINQENLGLTASFSMLILEREKPQDVFKMLNSSPTLQIKETPQGVEVENLSVWEVSSVDELLQLADLGAKNSLIFQVKTNLNLRKCFTVLILHLRSKEGMVSKVQFVELAGSEKEKKSGHNESLAPMSHINKSITALTLIIHRLAEESTSKKPIIPYRNSRITHILRESLGGNCTTFFLCSVSPSIYSYDESVSTLRFGNKVRHVKNNLIVVGEKGLGEELKKEKEKMKGEAEQDKEDDGFEGTTKYMGINLQKGLLIHCPMMQQVLQDDTIEY